MVNKKESLWQKYQQELASISDPKELIREISEQLDYFSDLTNSMKSLEKKSQ